MATTQEYVLLSLYVYDVKDAAQNRPLLPTGWTLLEKKTDNLLGFSYGVFKRSGTNEIVLAYTGTNGLIDWWSNFTAGTGLPAWQVANAALAYQQVKEKYGSNITLSGHSLGGGLASIVATWFDRPAVVFDEAPFQATAANSVMLAFVRAQLLVSGYTDSAMDRAFVDFSSREGRVANHYLQGEFLAAYRVDANTVAGSDTRIDINGSQAGPGQLHSLDLLVAARISEAFRLSTYGSTSVVPLMLDEKLYANDTAISPERNFVLDLIRSYQSSIVGQDKLTHFAADLQKLGANIAGLNKQAQNAVVAQGIEWYYWQGSDYAGQEFFTQTDALLQYSTAQGYTKSNGQPLFGALDKAQVYTDAWLTPILNASNEFGGTIQYAQWNVATGSAATSASARDVTKTQLFVGNSGADTMIGGALNDMLLGGDGADVLDGGGGNDKLYGGAGADRYDFTGAFGNDIVRDVDGSLWVDGIELTGGKKLSDNLWESSDGNFWYSVLSGFLIVSKGARAGVNAMQGRISVADWQIGQLGVTLDSTFATALPPAGTYVGDQRAPVNGSGDYDWASTSWRADGALVGGVAEANFSDVIYGTAAADKITGLGGDDALDGGAGNDVIDGGAGNDIIAGGTGSDIINGGAGDDLIYSAGSLLAPQRVRPDGWTATFANSFGTFGTDDAADVIDAGDGNDQVRASYGNDHISGGAGNDVLMGMAGDDVIEGGDGTDQLIGDAPESILAGSLHGNDFLDGGAGDDFLYGGGKDDTLYGGSGDDELNGDGVESQLAGEYHGNDYLDGEDGNDRLFGGGKDDTLYGGSGDDILDGDAKPTDLAVQFDGNDYLDGEDGNDMLYGQGGADTLYGGAGNDQLWGDSSVDIGNPDYIPVQYQGDDYLDGGAGDDYIEGGGGADTIYGGDGADTLWGDGTALRVAGASHGGDYIDGGDGDDVILGNGGADTLLGGAGDDIIRGDAAGQLPSDPAYLAGQFHGHDNLDGGDGNDQLWGDGGNDILMGGAGDDYLIGDDIESRLPTQFDGNDYLDGGEGDDYLSGGGGNDVLIGGPGADYLDGGDGDDTYEAGLGDTIHDTGGKNTIRFDGGAPTAVEVKGGDLVLNFGSGMSSLVAAQGLRVMASANSGANSLVIKKAFLGGDFTLNDAVLDSGFFDNYNVTLTTTEDNQHLSGWGGNDTLTAQHDAATLDGGAGDDVISGSWGNDLLIGGSGSNTLSGGDGDDILVSSGQRDVLNGGGGNDTFQIEGQAGEVTIDADTQYGNDTVVFAGSSATTALTATILDEDVVIKSTRAVTATDGTVGHEAGPTLHLSHFLKAGGEFSSSISAITFQDGGAISLAQLLTTNTMGSESADTLYGSLLVDHIDGGAGNDEIHAGGGNDVVLGGSGDDNLFGDSGNDTLEGGDGNDVLHGGDGSNILRGGAGDDTYVFGEDLVPSVSGDQGGSGQVNLIEDNEGANIISLGDGVNLDGLSFVKTSDSLSSLYFSGQKIEIHGLTSGFTVEVNGLTRSLESFVQVIPAPPVDLRLTPAQQAFLASRETSATLAISQAVLSRRFGAYTDATTSLWEQVNSNETDVGSVALPVWGWVTTEHEGVVGYHDSAGKPLSTNVVSGEYFGALSSVTSFFPLQQALFAQGKNVEVTSISPGTIYAGTDQQEQGGWRHGQVISWVWVGNDKAATPTYGTYTTREYTSHQDAHAANVVLGDADNSLRVGASVVHAGAGNDEISNRGDWIQHTSGIQLLQLLAGVTASFTDGGDGDDTIHGSQLDDVLYGGRGHDVLAGGSGRDQYLVLDYGQSSDDEDLIDDTSVTYIGEGGMLADPGSNDFDVVEFGPGIALEDIYFLRESNPDDVYTPDRIVAVRDGRRLASIVLAPSGYPQQAGIESLEFQDGRVLSMAEAVSISHIAVPLTVGTAPDAEIQEDGTFTYDAGAPFGGGTEAVTYSAKLASGSALPAWLSFDKATGAFTGTLSNEPATTFTVQVTATDKAGATGTVSFSIEVQSVNDAPVTNAIASDQTAFFDQPLLVQLGAELFTDVDVGDTLSWRLQLSDGRPLPSWLSFDATTRTLSGTPADADAGTLNLQVLVVDGANATASQTFQLTVTESDGIDLTGSGRADNLVGTAGDDHIDGLGGADVMTGGSGDDVYVVDNTRDVVKETANHGYDRIESVVSYTLPAEVEALVLKGTRNLSGTGNVLNNRLTGNSGSNRLDGGAGSDTMSGGAGNDVYVVDDVGDQVVEAADEGTDTVIASVSYTLSANVERLTLTGMGLVGTGNDLANLMTASDAGSVLAGLGGNDTLLGGSGADTLLGGDGNDRLDGGAGSDRMEGGAGNDVYLVDDLGDTVAELVGAGTDTVQASVTFTLPSNVENLTLSGSGDIGGTGNDLDNTIVGNASQNVLSGLGGNDRLRGGTGNDTLLGGDGNDRLDGGAGADRLSGGAGNDTYVVDDVGDLVEELANEGTDAVQSSISYVLGSNVENLTLTGLGTLSGTGNELNNVLTASGSGSVLYGLAGNDTLKGAAAHDILFGGEGNDRLDGGESADRLIGGAGDDVYVVDDVGDEVVEESSQGTDSVQAAISYTLVANVENLMLTGNAAINGTGNELANVITGNSASNRLAGLGGNDTLRGGAMADILIGGLGNDRLEGGLGADTYEFGRGDGQDTIVENDDTAGVLDKLHFDAGIAADQLWWRKSGNSLEVSVIGSTDKVTLSNWYLGAARHVEVFELANGSQLLDTQVQALVQAMASFSPPAAGQASLPANYESTLQPVIAANWH